ncbi:MAG: RHS repeat-associated core domain-containing protein [Bacteroidota bacterium]
MFQYNQGTGEKQFKTEREKDFDLHWDMTKYRTYDYQLGRFNQVDPKAEVAPQESQSPYQYSLNNPVRYNDPEGDCPLCLKALGDFAKGALIEVATQVTVNVISGKDAFDIDVADVFTAGATDVLTGGLATPAKVGKSMVRIATALAKNKKIITGGSELLKATTDVKRNEDGGFDVESAGGIVGGEKKTSDVLVDAVAGPAGGGSGKLAGGVVEEVSQGSLKGLKKRVKRTPTNRPNNINARETLSAAEGTIQGNKVLTEKTVNVAAGFIGNKKKDEINE